ncbi:MAG: alkene reductase [Bdellovibrionales bacterium RIFCSPHIGHO2_01_FULL_40_29]|nr:MAG: alkene reductase [Bdellovibrionales bacterium RIFCSPHIGHO2_01_FULL_40_29]OFZ34274.1 MAG: alkene reductase [Bdellovibrionales bacterium RIFCSPHIGHO2_02_FULL_40_15]
MSLLGKPLQLGDITLPNRIIMAPLTRSRAGDDRIPNDLMRDYYEQRASAGLIITEATIIDEKAAGYAATPGIYNEQQIAGWKKITDAVHAKSGRIFIQLWHVGRISDPLFLNGDLPVAPSAVRPAGHINLVRPVKEFVTPRALETTEVKQLVQKYKQAAINARKSDFDGVELHAANGYLVDQFLQEKTNLRTDEYGGSIENRARFLLEITDALIEVYGAGRVGVHLAPRMDSHDMGDSNPKALFGYVARELGKRKIAFIFTRETQGPGFLGDYLKKEFGGVLIANQKYSKEAAEESIARGDADAVSWGVNFIANPDLPLRLLENLPLNPPDPSHFYQGGAKGYTDYPFYSEN